MRTQYDTTVEHAWRDVGSYMSAAMQEVAIDLGGESFAEQIARAGASESMLPNPAAFQLLETTFPGSGKRVLDLSQKIQQAAERRRFVTAVRTGIRQGFTNGFLGRHMFGEPSRRH